MATLEENIREGDYSIEVRDTRMGQMAVLNKAGERTLDPQEQEELEDLLERYEDVVLELWNANEQLDGNERAWRMGQIYHEEVTESNERQIRTLNILLPFASERNRVEYLYRLFYETFPDQEYEESYAVMVLAELAQRSSPEEAREIYDHYLRGEEYDLGREDIRAWAEANSADFEEVIHGVKERVSNPKVKNVKNVYRLYGEDDLPAEDEIESALQEEE
jgi:hypothetical protein